MIDPSFGAISNFGVSFRFLELKSNGDPVAAAGTNVVTLGLKSSVSDALTSLAPIKGTSSANLSLS